MAVAFGVDLVCLLVSQINNCADCLDMHTRDLIKKGVMKIEKLGLLQARAEPGHLFYRQFEPLAYNRNRFPTD
jgi:AhpD family alkylhydroperoxidase